MTPEAKVKIRVKVLLALHNVYWHMPVQNGMGAPSLDFVCCHKGRYFAIETKAGDKKATPRQQITINAIHRAGGPAFVVNETPKTWEILEEYLKSITGE
jgi:hypothetical protein